MLRWTGLSVLLLSALLPDLGEANSGIVRFIRVASTPFGESLLVGNRHGRALVLAVDQSALDLSIASRPALHLEQLTRTLRRAAARGITPELSGRLSQLENEFRHLLRTTDRSAELIVQELASERLLFTSSGGTGAFQFTEVVSSRLTAASARRAFIEGAQAQITRATLRRQLARGPVTDLQAGGADLIGLSVSDFSLINADLRFASAQGSFLTRGSAVGARMERIRLRGAVLREVDLSGAQMRRADFYGARLDRVNLRGADLTEADLRMAVFGEGTDLTGVALEGALFDARSILPFDRMTAESLGMQFVAI